MANAGNLQVIVDLTPIEGAGFDTANDSLKVVSDVVDIVKIYQDKPMLHNHSYLIETLSGLLSAVLPLYSALTQIIIATWTHRYIGAPCWCYSIKNTGVVPHCLSDIGNGPAIIMESGAANADASGIAAVSQYLILPNQAAAMFPDDLKLIFEWYGLIDNADNNGNLFNFFIGMTVQDIQGGVFVGIFEAKTSHARRFGFSSNGSADKKIVGVCADNVAEQNTVEFVAEFNRPHMYKAVYTIGSQIEFFYDNISKGVLNANMPVSGTLAFPLGYSPMVSTARVTASTYMAMQGFRVYFTKY